MEDDLIRPGTAFIFFMLLFLEMMVYGFASAIQNRKEQDQDDSRKEPDKKAARLQYMIDNPARYRSEERRVGKECRL